MHGSRRCYRQLRSKRSIDRCGERERSRYHGFNADAREIEIGWTFLARSHWGGRYNGELKQLMLEHAFQFVDRVIFVIGAENTRSRLAVERIGATLLASHTSEGPGRVVYAISRVDYNVPMGLPS